MLKDLQQFLTEPRILGKIFDWGIIWGSFLGVLCVLVAVLVLKEHKAILFSLLLLAGSALLVWPSEACRKRPLVTDVDHAVPLKKISLVRQQNAWIFYAQGALASLAAMTLSSKGNAGKVLLGASLLGGLVVAGFGLWLQIKELQILSPVMRLSLATPALNDTRTQVPS